MIASGKIAAVHVGKVAPLGCKRRSTAFLKTPVVGPVQITKTGLAGDEQANRKLHGGLEKAVYGYPFSGYAGWQADFPELADRMVAGGMGENLVISGLDETQVCIGDIVRCGAATLQISQIREPCNVFADVHGTSRVVRAMTRSGRCGWYYRVLETGDVAAGDPHAIVERPNPDWSVARFALFAASKAASLETLEALAMLPGLTPAWQARALKSLGKSRS